MQLQSQLQYVMEIIKGGLTDNKFEHIVSMSVHAHMRCPATSPVDALNPAVQIT